MRITPPPRFLGSCLAVLFIFISPTAHAVNWLKTGKTADGSRRASIDTDSIRYHGGLSSFRYLSVWIKWDYAAAQKTSAGKLYRQSKVFYYIDCGGKKLEFVQGMDYTSKGNVVDSFNRNYISTLSSDSWNATAPETIGESIVDETCYYAQNK
ncbi:surface-adhesin E family protein [Moraxella cuniculi]|uniref:Surface-adhesin protein E-like domain-containing protein n=1 Tax=Moraxella cuniculi TaxID=34061 RepID=A0A3S4QRI9_9GAMM|nr:surface-adhesin E family protein [Moraxella cuniculi]VEG12635.1 Uncharacterised protein [Moraxella cuniculi]